MRAGGFPVGGQTPRKNARRGEGQAATRDETTGFLLRLLASQVTVLEFFGYQMSFEFDSSDHNEFLLDLNYFCNSV
jgi:hypothetical protein